MFISVIHRISDPDAFWATAASAAKDIPADIKLHQTVTSNDRSTAICLWEAASVDGAPHQAYELEETFKRKA